MANRNIKKRQQAEEAEGAEVARHLRLLVVMDDYENESLFASIKSGLLEIEDLRSAASAHDAEMARLRDDTRRLIAEMQRDLNLRAA